MADAPHPRRRGRRRKPRPATDNTNTNATPPPPLPPPTHHLCVLCANDADTCCGRCTTTFYCSPACQRRHWATDHRFVCTRDGKPLPKPVEFDPIHAHRLSMQHKVWAALGDNLAHPSSTLSAELSRLHDLEFQLLALQPTDAYRLAAEQCGAYLQRNKAAHVRSLFLDGWRERGVGALITRFESLEQAHAMHAQCLRFQTLADFDAFSGRDGETSQLLRSSAFDHTTSTLLVIAIQRGILVDTVHVAVWVHTIGVSTAAPAVNK